jgi:hypothetical protein
MVVEDITTFLKGDPGLTAVVNGRVYPVILPQGATLPALVYSEVHGQQALTLGNDKGFTDALFQISCMASSYLDSKTLAKALRAALQGYAGTMGSTVVQGAFEESERDSYNAETKEYRTDLDFRIFHLDP